MTAKEYLNQAWELNQQITDKLEKAERLRHDLYGRGISYETTGAGSPNGGTDAIGKAVCRIIDFEREADEMIDEMIKIKIHLEGCIAELDDRRYRKILERRYLFFESFESIAERLSYSKKHIYRLHDMAVSALDEKLRQDATECD